MDSHIIKPLVICKRFLSAKTLRSLTLYIVTALLCSGQPLYASDIARPVDFNYDFTEFISWLEDGTSEKEIPGAALAIVSSEGIMHLQTWGVRNVAERGSVTSDSVFRIASMSKTFAGAAATLLVSQNLQSWDSTVSEMFPGLIIGTSDTSRDINLRHIASHSTGLMPHSYSNMLDDGVEYERIRSRFDKIPTVCQPGRCYGYQNVVFSLIADVVEQSTGASYEDYLYEQLFKPLGMMTATVGMEPYLNSDEATKPHRMVRGNWQTTSINPAYYSTAPAAGVNASIFDMSLWLQANLGGFPEVMPPAFLSEMHEPVIDTPNGYFRRWSGLEKAYYAIGWRVFDYKGLRAVHHGGGVRGYRSEMTFVPDADIGMVLLFNAESNLANDVVPAFLDNLTNAAGH